MKRIETALITSLIVAAFLATNVMPSFGYSPGASYTWGPGVPNYNPSAVIYTGTIDTSLLVIGDFLGVSSTQPNAPGYGDSGAIVGWDDAWVSGVGHPNTNGDNLDGLWAQIIYPAEGWWDLGFKTDQVVVFLSQDHGPYLAEGLETRVYGSNTLWGAVSAQAVLTDVYLDGWRSHNPAEDGNGNGWCSDDIAGVYKLPGMYQYVKIAAWSSVPALDEPEVDAVATWKRALDKRIHKKVKVIPAPVQFWREFIGGVTDIIVFDPPEIIEPVALVREYMVLHEGEGPIPLEFLTWENMDGYPWEPIDPPEEPYILPPDGIVEYDIPTVESDTAVLVRYTVAWASTPNIIEAHFINEAILESRSPQVIIGQLCNFDVHNDYHEPVDNFELELYGIQPSDIVGWFPGWGTPPEINPIPPSAGMPGGTEIIWMDPDQPVMPCQWEHFGLHLKPSVIAVGIKAYWTQIPSAELGDVIHTKIDVTVPPRETATVVDTLPSMVSYITGTFTVDGVTATPTITTTSPPPPIITKISYTITTPGIHLIEFDVKVDEAKNWEDTEVCNVATATWYDEAGEVIETKEDVECFTIHPFEELHKNVGIPKADVVFAIDLSGSMWSELSVIQTQAPTIINNIASQIADVKFGLITFVDYAGTYTTTSTVPGAVPTTYTATYGKATSGDYPYKLDQDIGSAAGVIAKIGTLTTKDGWDWPQDYSRILHESWNDTNLHWRTNATRFLILFGDAQPHDTGFDYDNNGIPNNTGGDPGRDTILGNADDLDFETEVANAAAAGIHVLGVYSGGASMKEPWTYMATQTDGQFFWLTAAGQIPDAIKETIKAEAHETLTIKEKTETQWALVIDVHNPFPYTMTNVMIKDNFGAEIEIDEIVMMADPNGDAMVGISDLMLVARALGTDESWPQGTDWNEWNPKTDFNKDGKVGTFDLCVAGQSYGSYVEMELILDETGNSEKVHLTWHIGNLAPCKTARLILLVSTDLNPAGHQEYTEPGIYEMNSGATLKFIDPEQNMQLSAYTDSIYVTVLPEDDP